MKTNQLLSAAGAAKTLCSAMFAGALLFSSSVFAQVKIGSNPATIGTNSNLEVEATNSKKVIVNKDNGTVVIQNTPSGAVTDSVVTVDASGNVRGIGAAKLKTMLGTLGASSMTTSAPKSFAVGTVTFPDFTTILFDENNGVDLANDNIILKVAGTYTISTTTYVQLPGPNTVTANIDMYLQKFSVSTGLWTNVGRSQAFDIGTLVNIETLTYVGQFAAGDKVRLAIVGCTGCIPNNPNYTLNKTDFFVLRNL